MKTVKFEKVVRVDLLMKEKENKKATWKPSIIADNKEVRIKNLCFSSAESAAEWFLSQPWDEKVAFVDVTEFLYINGWCASCLVSTYVTKGSDLDKTIADMKKSRNEEILKFFNSRF